MVVEGADEDYNRSSVLHEAAHHIAVRCGQGPGHALGFYVICWDLLLADGLPLEKMVAMEVSYMPQAWPALLAMGVEVDEVVVEIARSASQQRDLYRAEKAVDAAARRLAARQASEESAEWQTYSRALGKWKRLDDAMRAGA
jgi:hypothetical protein